MREGVEKVAGDLRDHGVMTGQTVGDIYTEDVVQVSPSTPVSDVANLISSRKVNSIPVVDGNRLVGIVARIDLIRTMIKQRGGRIVNIASIAGQMGNAGQTNYAATKAGIIGFSKSLAREVASRNITVNAIAPGFINTEMTQALPEKTREELTRQIPMRRIGEPQDIAEAVYWLCSEAAGYITGQVLAVNGGMYM